MEDNSNIELRSERIQDLLSEVPHWMIRWGNSIILGLVLCLLFITWLIKYPDIIPAEATITTLIPPQKEYAKTTGKFDAILVSDNDQVKAGEPLAIIENTANYLDVIQLQSIIDTINLRNENFDFPITQIPLMFLGDMEAQFALFENDYLKYKLNEELNPYSKDLYARKNSLIELQNQLSNLKSQKVIQKKELGFLKLDLDRSKTLFEKGVISAQDYERKQLEYTQAERSFAVMETSLSQLRDAIINMQNNAQGTQISKTREDIILLKSTIQSFHQLKKAIKDWESTYVLKSEIDGTVSFLNYWSINQTVNQGDLVFTIIPSKYSTFIAKLKIPQQNSGKVEEGQKVKISIENYPEEEYGTLEGTVDHVSLIPDKEGYYLIDVKLPKTLITSYNKEIVFRQEMQGQAEIITEDLRMIERLFYQIKNIFN